MNGIAHELNRHDGHGLLMLRLLRAPNSPWTAVLLWGASYREWKPDKLAINASFSVAAEQKASNVHFRVFSMQNFRSLNLVGHDSSPCYYRGLMSPTN